MLQGISPPPRKPQASKQASFGFLLVQNVAMLQKNSTPPRGGASKQASKLEVEFCWCSLFFMFVFSTFSHLFSKTFSVKFCSTIKKTVAVIPPNHYGAALFYLTACKRRRCKLLAGQHRGAQKFRKVRRSGISKTVEEKSLEWQLFSHTCWGPLSSEKGPFCTVKFRKKSEAKSSEVEVIRTFGILTLASELLPPCIAAGSPRWMRKASTTCIIDDMIILSAGCQTKK